jgi:hypothetical protein
MIRCCHSIATRLPALALAMLFAVAIPGAPVRAADCAAVSCFDAGPFVAEVTSVSPSWDRSHRVHYLRLNVRFRNTGAQPISLAFPWRAAATMTDNYGNTYNIDWRYPQRIVGIAVISRNGVKGNFTIAPGSSRTASWIFSRSAGSTPVGNAFTADLPVEDLQPIPGQQKVRVGNQYSLDFQQLHGGSLGMLGDGATGNREQVAEGVARLLQALEPKHRD